MHIRVRLASLPVIALVLSTQTARAEEEAERVFRLVHPSVVGIQNAEGSGTGILLSADGLILTNAHVVVSPLALRVLVDSKTADGVRTVQFLGVRTVGIHPSYDLALLKVDPAECGVPLSPATLAKARAKEGATVYAIGNPVTCGAILSKTITKGSLAAIVQGTDSAEYYEFSAPVNPGNSGGPLCDGDGTILGIVTFKRMDVEGVGYAIPLHDLQVSSFVPVDARKKDIALAAEYVRRAREYDAVADELVSKYGIDDERYQTCNYVRAMLYREALLNDPDNPGLLYNIGMFWRCLNSCEIAVAYLVRAIQVDPWGNLRGDPYRELGFSLVTLRRRAEAKAVYDEGLAMFPRTGVKMWDDMTAYSIEEKDYVQACFCASVAIAMGDDRAPELRALHQQVAGDLPSERRQELEKREARIEEFLADMQRESDAARQAGKLHLTSGFGELLHALASPPPPPPPPAPTPTATDPTSSAASDEQAKAEALKWIKSKVSIAKNYIGIGSKEKAIAILEEVIRTHPDHPETVVARKLLEGCRKSK